MLGETNVFTFDVQLSAGDPVRHKDKRWSHEELAIMKEQIDLLLGMGMIEPSNSAWASRLVMVTKKAGTTRVCVDFRDVNKRCKRDAYPAPQIEQTLDQLGKAKYYTSLDGEKGYHQVGMTARAKEISAFRSPFGLFQFLRMPFGLTNAPAAFQRMMDRILHGLAWKCCMVYLDDIVIYSATW
ncbi:MAG: reverse transcriptase family protein, partial [bacterium]